MSSRALRRLHEDSTVIRVPAGQQQDGDEEDDPLEEGPGFTSSKSRKPVFNPFAMLEDDGDGESEGDGGDSEQEQRENDSPVTKTQVSNGGQSSKKKKKRKKKSKQNGRESTEQAQGGVGTEDVDAVIKEVNELLGEAPVRETEATSNAMAAARKTLLSVDKRFLNAENEMRRIFGSRVVRAEAGRRRAHRRAHHRSTILATPKDTWPTMDKPGLSMAITENKDGCQYFVFEHSQDYQRIQLRFWDAVETFDPESIVEVLHAHPYHIDSLLQLSEVCKMSEDIQMATELIERALYCFECNLHALFNFTQGNCRLSYSKAENRPFFIALFRHLSYVGRKGCHRTALEFCKLLLGLEPEGDPLCVLLMIDYFALRAGEYDFLLELFRTWESHRNLSQLPNFAFSIPLALFHSSTKDGHNPIPESSEADKMLQDSLLMFPSLLLPLMEKCSVNLDPSVSTHTFFSSSELTKESGSLQLLIKLYIERSHSLWKEPEVLTWLEENSRQVIARVDANDNLVADYAIKRGKRYVGTPRNIYRHVVMSDFDQVAATLPRELSESPILMYDPLPPLDSTSGYSRPERQPRANRLAEDENPFLLFLRSLLPTFDHQGGAGRARGGDHPNPAVRQLQAQLAAARAQRDRPPARERGGGGEEVGGAVGPLPATPEGQPGQPLDLQRPLDQIVDLLVQFLGGARGGRAESPHSSEDEDSDNNDRS